jgi:type IV secretory pathway VirB4 component
MADETKQTQTENTTQIPEWLNNAENKQPEAKKAVSPTENKDTSGDLPSWVKSAGKPKEEAAAEIKAEPVVETADKVKQEEVKEKAEKKKSIFDNFKNIFSVEQNKQAEIAKSTVVAAQTDKKSKVTPEEMKKIEEAEKLYQEGLATVRDLIAPASMEIDFDSVRVEGMYAQTFYVFAYPRYLDSNWLSPVINFDVTMDISQFVYPIDSAAIMKVLKRKVAQLQSSIRIAEEKGNVRDPAIETALQDAEELRTQIQRGQEKFFQLGLYFTIYAEDKKKLQRVAKQISSLLAGKLVMIKRADLQAEHAFNSTIPICTDELEVTLNMNTSPLSTMFPFTSADLTSNTGILYGLNRHNDSLIIFDRFKLENANSVVFAKSGAGKSYAIKLEILRSLMFGTDVIVIDPENEYEAISEVVGGSYMKVSLNSDRRINPFDLPAPLKDEVVKPGDLLRANIIALHGLLKIMLGGVTPEEEGMLDKALTDVYALRGITMEIEDPSSIAPPTMEDLYDILNSMEGGKDLATRLAKFTSGTYSGIFNKPTNIDLTSGLVVFSIRDLEDALRPIAMYIILNYIWNNVRSSLKRRILVIDEAWSLMQHDDSARFLYGLVKRARKYYLGVTTITQDVEDFVSNKFGKPIITNSSMQILLKQAPAAIDILQNVFNLTEGEKYMLLNSGIGQGLFFAGNKHVAIQIIASYGEDKLVTTNPEEILQAQAEEVEYEGAEAAEVPEVSSEPDLGPAAETEPEPGNGPDTEPPAASNF